MNASDLLILAGELNASSARGTLRQAHLRRSISTSYYALFHALARLCADELVGAGKARSTAWRQAYRALDHGAAKNALIDLAGRDGGRSMTLPADAFAELQRLRHEADYDLHLRYTLSEAVQARVLAEVAIASLQSLTTDEKLLLAVTLLTKTRRPIR